MKQDGVPPVSVNNLMPDCQNSEDEWLYEAVLKKVVGKNLCLPQSLPGMPAPYFPIEKLCVYEVDIELQMAYCRNGFHMKKCTNFFCSQTFKYESSYGVPPHYICDVVWLCPNGEDEQHYIIKSALLCQVTVKAFLQCLDNVHLHAYTHNIFTIGLYSSSEYSCLVKVKLI